MPMQSPTNKTLFRGIRKTLGRYIAVAAIIALGVGLFSGLKVSRTAMVETYAVYLEETRLYDYRLVSTLGFEQADVDAFAALDGIEASEGNVAVDALVQTDKGETAYRIFALPETINMVTLTEGRMPEVAGETLADAARFDPADIGETLMLAEDDAMFAEHTLTIVGLATSPQYISTERGVTQLAGGTLSGFLYVHPDTMESDVYTDLYLTIAEPAALYSKAYDGQIDTLRGPVEALLEERVQARHDVLLSLVPTGLGLEAGIPSPAGYLLTRSENLGYASFESDTQIVSGISNIFPAFFFLVAILICITTMTRMVEEERTQIGAMKAMGYGSFAIIKKYKAHFPFHGFHSSYLYSDPMSSISGSREAVKGKICHPHISAKRGLCIFILYTMITRQKAYQKKRVYMGAYLRRMAARFRVSADRWTGTIVV